MAADPHFLSSGQKKIIGIFLTFAAWMGIAALLVYTISTFLKLLGFFSAVLWPLAIAGILALTLRPVIQYMETKWKIRRLFAVILLYVVFFVFLIGIGLVVVPPLVDQTLELVSYVPSTLQNLQKYSQTHNSEWTDMFHRYAQHPAIKKFLEDGTHEIQGMLGGSLPSLKQAGAKLIAVFHFATALVLIPVYLLFFLLSRQSPPRRKWHDTLSFLSESTRSDVIFLAGEFISILVAFFRGQVVIALLMGVMLATGFSLVGLNFGLPLGFVLGLLNLIPYFGTIVGLCVTIPMALFQQGGGMVLALLAVLVFAVCESIQAWIVTPRIMGKQTGLHPVVIITSILFWGTAFDGLFGVLMAIPLTAFFVTAWRLAHRKYFGKVM